MHSKYQHLQELGLLQVEHFMRKWPQHSEDSVVQWFLAGIPQHWKKIPPDKLDIPKTLDFGILEQQWTVKQIHCFLRDKTDYVPVVTD